MTHATTDAVRKTITVSASQEHAFNVFTGRIGTWWPLADKSIGSADPETAILEPKAGGRWYERGVDGSECDWGRVLRYEPFERLVLNWQIGADWRYSPDLHTEVDVRFIAEGPDRTRVELEHRNLDAFGEHAEQMRTIFDSPGGWGGIIDGYQQIANA